MSFIPLLLAAQGTTGAFDPGPNPLLMRNPTINQTTIVFQFAGDLWTVPREGGQARRLTSSQGSESAPRFSPDGRTIAFSAQYDGNTDVYVMPAEGGNPKRLTAHPSADIVLGWSPDGKSVLFTSGMNTTHYPRMYTVPTSGGVPKALPFPSGSQASFSPDGSMIAYVPNIKWEDHWKRYRGGQAYPIWIGAMSDSRIKAVPRKSENIQQPMWVGDSIYYTSDEKGPVGLNRYDTKSGKVSIEIPGSGFDIKSASAGDGVIVYEKLGSINVYDPSTKKSSRVPVEINADFPEARPQFKDMGDNISGAGISPTGTRVALSARGFVFTVPNGKGDPHLLTEKQGVHRREPYWSPDGRYISYITDEHGVQEMGLYDISKNTERFLPLGESPAYYSNGAWSPDSKKIAYTDYRTNVWILDVESGTNTKVDRGIYFDPNTVTRPRWSPDSKWITYNRDLDNHLNAVFVYNVDTKQATQLTNGLANAQSPVFDRDGKCIYFFASTNTGWASSWLDMSSFTVPNVTSSVYAIVLSKDGENPLGPESDEEAVKEAPAEGAPAPQGPPKAPEKKDASVQIDFEDIERRIVNLPMQVTNYVTIEPGPPGSFFIEATSNRANFADFAVVSTLYKYSVKERRATPFASPVFNFQVSGNGAMVLLQRPGGFAVVPSAMPPQPGQGGIRTDGLNVKLDPGIEWTSMFREVWRNEPMLFYDEGLHGIDPKEMDRRYLPFLKNIKTREDLNYLFEDMIGELSIGHMWAQGGDLSFKPGVPGGLLGADYSFENGKYKLTRVYDGESWNPNLVGPLSVPGVGAKAGEYLLEIDGKPLNDEMDIYLFLEGKAGKQVKVKIGPNANGDGARVCTVVPVASENGLRIWAWREDNRRKVAELSDGKIGYVHIPDTGIGGWSNFQRFYYAQTDKQGIVIDERFNTGGYITDYIISEMMKPFSAAFTSRYALKDFPTPGASIFGPKVMLANEFSGSGGDMLPWLFKFHKIGKVVGTRTWGGLVASARFTLADGGVVNAPDGGFYNPHTNKWEIEGYGVDPDIEVMFDPYLWRQGRDPQLEKAVAVALDELKNMKLPSYKRPPSADKSKVGGGR